jgi:2-succinyl-5-enolpyruvyl-6-hydroxy-3-cyclohexene-1-carboxylate synthase
MAQSADSEAVAPAAHLCAAALIDELARSGLRHACLCPGSRSAPLAYALAAERRITTWVHIDERSAAFFALGLARASGLPALLVCTSGTAAANFLPAIIEARYARVPLLVLTADRPPELRDNGAPQAIDQIHLYGDNVKWFVEVSLPDAQEATLRYVRTLACRAMATAQHGPAGPVHLNLPFREPLVPPQGLEIAAPYGRPNGRPYAEVPPVGAVTAGRLGLDDLACELLATPRGLIVCGPESYPLPANDVVDLARHLGYPILADPLSGLRCGPHQAGGYVLDAYDAYLRDPLAQADRPDVALQLGAAPTSKALQTFLRDVDRHVLVDAQGGWREPGSRAGLVLRAHPAQLAASVAGRGMPDAAGPWLERWRQVDRSARGAIAAFLETLEEPFEGRIFAELARLLPDGSALFAGNSMPVRDLDTFFPGCSKRIRFLCNRGANGIDGVVSTALGAAASGWRLVLVLGDLSFYHDLNGLLAARRYPIDATIVLVNNDGGGIFSFLPQAALPEHFEALFGTPTGLDFRSAIEMYGCGYRRAETWPAFCRDISESLASPGVQVVEMRTERLRNVELHRKVWRAVRSALWYA